MNRDSYQPGVVSALHEERLETVVHYLLSCGAASVLDLGCGTGELLARLARHGQLTRIVGLDIDRHAVGEARALLGVAAYDPDARVQVHCGSFEEADSSLEGFDAAALVETIEHIDPRRLSQVEDAIFGSMRPGTVLITTPNQEFNALHGLAPGELRHWDHRFEWSRARFRQWARGVARRKGYAVGFVDIGPPDPLRGSSTQMARFTDLAAEPALAVTAAGSP